MAHEFESGVLYRAPAWHGLGTVADELLSPAQAIRRGGQDWLVEKRAVRVDPRGKARDRASEEVAGRFALVRDSDAEVLGFVAKDYTPFQNEQGAELAEAIVGEGATVETSISLFGGRLQVMQLHLPEDRIVLGEQVRAFCALMWGHDGIHGLSAFATGQRIVCNNTLQIAQRGARRRWGARHSTNVMERVEEAKNTIGLVSDYMDEVERRASRYAARVLSDYEIEDLLDEVFPSGHGPKQKAAMAQLSAEVVAAMRAPDLEAHRKGNGMDCWGVYNAFADWASHREPSVKRRGWKERRFLATLEGNPVLRVVEGILDEVTTPV